MAVGVGCAGFGVGWRLIDAWSARRTACPFAAVDLAVDLDQYAVVHQPVHRCRGHGAGGEDVLHTS